MGLSFGDRSELFMSNLELYIVEHLRICSVLMRHLYFLLRRRPSWHPSHLKCEGCGSFTQNICLIILLSLVGPKPSACDSLNSLRHLKRGILS